ncbi:hypothetical protein [Thalassospira sp.]|uniref:hypothetical protein n=1 Tax=Thalassospira sp. TaxID=1912094 RepID=UPI0027331502|nr:hypothetical protein [Thalassospira sp.]MDP2697412.1 hypothetical protein [Thalassospira sp.]
MVFGRGQSADTNGGWKNHYQRMRRWEARSLLALRNLPESDFKDAIDFSLAYFVWCHSLFEWLHEDGAIDKLKLSEKLNSYQVWPLCRDIANRVRHFDLRRKPTDKDWSAYREYLPFEYQIAGKEKHVANIMFDGRKWRIDEAISEASRMWEEIARDMLNQPDVDKCRDQTPNEGPD